MLSHSPTRSRKDKSNGARHAACGIQCGAISCKPLDGPAGKRAQKLVRPDISRVIGTVTYAQVNAGRMAAGGHLTHPVGLLPERGASRETIRTVRTDTRQESIMGADR
jgi:hypothetical protein